MGQYLPEYSVVTFLKDGYDFGQFFAGLESVHFQMIDLLQEEQCRIL